MTQSPLTPATPLASAAFWNGTDIFVRQGGQFIFAIVLARLVSPEEFGVVAMLAFFTALSRTFVDAGFSSALIQRQELTHDDESTVFWFNLFSGTVIAILFGLSAPLIAGFYGEPRLVALTWAMSFNIWFAAWLAVPNALLVKKLDFRTQMKASSAGILIGGFLGIWLGFEGAGVWALAAQTLAASAITVALTWTLIDWRPALLFRWSSFYSLAGFGSYMFLSSLLEAVSSRLYTVLIGKFYSPADLGFYGRASQTKDFSQGAIGNFLSRITFPVFSTHAHNRDALRHQIRRALRWSMALNIPLVIGLAATATDAVAVLFGERWSPAAPILGVLVFAGLLTPMHIVNCNALMADGRSNLIFRLEVIKKLQLVVVILAVSAFGVMAIAWGTVFCSLSGYYINSWYARRYFDYSPFYQIRDVLPYLAAGALMGVLVLAVRLGLSDFPAILRLLIEVFLGVTFYLTVLWLFGLEAFSVGQRLLRSSINYMGQRRTP